MSNNHEEQIRFVQETVAGKEITFAHVTFFRDSLGYVVCDITKR